MESGLLSEKRLAGEVGGFVCIKVKCCDYHPVLPEYGLRSSDLTRYGAVLVLSPDGGLLEKFVGEETPLERLLEGMRKAELKHGFLRASFLNLYFSMDQPDMEPSEVKDLLDNLGVDLIEVRELATARAIQRGAPAYRALKSIKSPEADAEARARVKQILGTLEPQVELVRRHSLDRDVEFLARLMDHPDVNVRVKAQARVRRILPHIDAKSSAELRERWLAEKDRLRWDGRRGLYESK